MNIQHVSKAASSEMPVHSPRQVWETASLPLRILPSVFRHPGTGPREARCLAVTQGMTSIGDMLPTTTAPRHRCCSTGRRQQHTLPRVGRRPSMFNAMLLELLMGRLACICSGQVVQHKRIHAKRNEGRKHEKIPNRGTVHCPRDEPSSSPREPACRPLLSFPAPAWRSRRCRP
jgi:hypothetical protein